MHRGSKITGSLIRMGDVETQLSFRLGRELGVVIPRRDLSLTPPRLQNATVAEEFAGLKQISDLPRFSVGKTVYNTFRMFSPKAQRESYKMSIEFHKAMGKIGFSPFPIPSVMIFDPDVGEKALRNQGATPSRGPFLPWIDYWNDRGEAKTLLVGEGEEWKKSRSVVSKKLMPPRNVQSFEPALLEVVDHQIEKLSKSASRFAAKDSQGRHIVEELPNEMYKWAMESVGTVIFETRLGCLRDPVPANVQTFIDSIGEMFRTGLPALIGYNFQKKIGSPFVKRHFQAWDNIFDFVRATVGKRKDELLKLAETTEVSQKEGAVLTYLLLDESITDGEVYANLTELMLAGVDTTSNTLVWTLYELVRNPHHLRRLEAEIEEVLGPEDRPCTKSIHKMPFLKNVVKETLRKFPVVLAMGRTMDKDIELEGYFLPRGTNVTYFNYAICHDENIFSNPEEFDPTRWDKSLGRNFHPFSSLPFGFGPRSCIGKRLAELEMHLMLARIVQRFHLRRAPDLSDVEPVMRMLLTPPADKLIPIEFIPK